MHEMKAQLERVKEAKKTLMSWVEQEIALGCKDVDVKSLGETVDMVKDLAETEKECSEALYYQTVTEAMLEGEKDPYYGEMMGYNNRRMANGRYASAGHGHPTHNGHVSMSGYRPFIDQEPYVDDYIHDPNGFQDRMRHTRSMMGYDGGSSYQGGTGDYGRSSSRHGEVYDRYKDAKRHYTETKSSSDKEEMNAHSKMYVKDAMDHIMEMWEDADPTLKKYMKEDFRKLIDKMTV